MSQSVYYATLACVVTIIAIASPRRITFGIYLRWFKNTVTIEASGSALMSLRAGIRVTRLDWFTPPRQHNTPRHTAGLRHNITLRHYIRHATK